MRWSVSQLVIVQYKAFYIFIDNYLPIKILGCDYCWRSCMENYKRILWFICKRKPVFPLGNKTNDILFLSFFQVFSILWFLFHGNFMKLISNKNKQSTKEVFSCKFELQDLNFNLNLCANILILFGSIKRAEFWKFSCQLTVHPNW